MFYHVDVSCLWPPAEVSSWVLDEQNVRSEVATCQHKQNPGFGLETQVIESYPRKCEDDVEQGIYTRDIIYIYMLYIYTWYYMLNCIILYTCTCIYIYLYTYIIYIDTIVIIVYKYPKPVSLVPHKAMAEVSKIGHFRRGELLGCIDGRANPLMDRKVVGVVCFGVVAMVAVVTWPTTAGCSVVCSCSCSVVWSCSWSVMQLVWSSSSCSCGVV